MLNLTCLPEKVAMYEKMGLKDKGISGSSWGELLSEEYREDGIFVRAWVPKEFHYM